MHAYYKENAGKLRKQMNSYLCLIRGDIERIFAKPYEEALEEIWKFYEEQLMEKFPYIGGDFVSGTKNLTGAYFFVALGEAASLYGLSLEDWGKLTTVCMERYLDKTLKPMRTITGFLFSREKLMRKMLEKKDRKNHENALKNPGSFETKVQEPTEEYPVHFHTLRCPLNDFAEVNGYTKYMPYLCNLDYVMFGKMGVSLYREKTCATGDGCCDFKFKKNGPIPSYWPPHILDENDPLK